MAAVIEFIQAFENRKPQIRELLLACARGHTTIRYRVIYKLFEEEKGLCAAENIWRACVWQTVEEVCQELASRQGAIYTAMLSNGAGVPEAGFWDQFRGARKVAYEVASHVILPATDQLTLTQKIAIVRFERARVYRHAKIHHPL